RRPAAVPAVFQTSRRSCVLCLDDSAPFSRFLRCKQYVLAYGRRGGETKKIRIETWASLFYWANDAERTFHQTINGKYPRGPPRPTAHHFRSHIHPRL